jgi:hypothetical protein
VYVEVDPALLRSTSKSRTNRLNPHPQLRHTGGRSKSVPVLLIQSQRAPVTWTVDSCQKNHL